MFQLESGEKDAVFMLLIIFYRIAHVYLTIRVQKKDLLFARLLG